ncbi:MAG: hypothetical protein QGI75_02730 [Phycisphaerales bacterium]|jgi:hypothetical protein|nr:hypothetical protein [Phycisphaerales bacterium]MDP6889965.1 hypothetical protein [Phycisphaerales bacterium]
MNAIRLLVPLVCLSGAVSAATPTIEQTLALRGSGLVIPLTAVSGNDDPIASSLVDGNQTIARLDSHLVWINAKPRTPRAWSLPSHRTLVSGDETSGGTPYLVLSLPHDGRGHLVVDGTLVRLHWANLPDSMPTLRQLNTASDDEEFLPYAAPPLQDPLGAWRCELIAAMRGHTPPSLDRFTDLPTRLIAAASIGPWRRAMQQLAEADRGVARQVAELLTGTTQNEGHSIAAWLSRGSALDELLAIALGSDTAENPRATRALRWCERQTSLLVWITADRGGSVLISLANPEPHAVLAEIMWAIPGELPLASSVPAGASTMTHLEPLPLRELAPLLLEVGQNHMTLPIDRSIQDVEPPGLMLGPLHPNRTLSDVHTGLPPPPAPMSRQTFAQFRKLMGHWEVMLECRWNGPQTDPHDGESVTIDLRVGDRRHVIEVAPDGLRSSHQADTPTVHVSRLDHAWLCRVVLPDAWIADQMSIALLRTHADSPAFETWPTPCVPWRIAFDPTPMNLSAWDQDAAAEMP